MPETGRHPRVVLVHDWLCGLRGGEHVLDRVATVARDRFDLLGLLVMFDDHRPVTPMIDSVERRASWLGRLPGASGPLRRWLLPAYPLAVRSLSRLLARINRETPIDLVVSTSSAAVKGIRAPAGVPHLCYCHAPARYLWGRAAQYAGGSTGALRSAGLRLFGTSLRRWDRRTAANVTRFIANSSFTASEIRRCYARDSVVVHPPVRVQYFTPSPAVTRERFWLVAGALEPYKQAELAIDAARLAKTRLVIAGSGSQERSLRARAAGAAVEFVGRVSDAALRDLYRRAELLLFPQVEDFGIVAVEAQACGLPVVARHAGGALDTVIPGVTGAFFEEPTPEAIVRAVESSPRGGDVDVACRRNAERFAEERFDRAIEDEMRELLKN